MEFMKFALAEAEIALERKEVPVGAVIVLENKIIAKTHNLTETLKDVTAHAEILAITSASQYLGAKYLRDCTLYVTLEPCAMCASALFWAKIGKVVYAASDEKNGYSKYQPNILHPKTKVVKGILEEESLKLLKTFFSKKR